MSPSVKAVTRVSQTLADYIGSLSENENAATRALILLGAAELGLDPTLVEDDLRLTMAARLPPELYARLQALRERVDQRALPQRPVRGGRATGAAADDTGAAAAPAFPAPLPSPARPTVTAAPASGADLPAPEMSGEDTHQAAPAQSSATWESRPVGAPQAEDVRPAPGAPATHMEGPASDAEETFDPFSGVGFDFEAPGS